MRRTIAIALPAAVLGVAALVAGSCAVVSARAEARREAGRHRVVDVIRGADRAALVALDGSGRSWDVAPALPALAEAATAADVEILEDGTAVAWAPPHELRLGHGADETVMLVGAHWMLDGVILAGPEIEAATRRLEALAAPDG